VTVWQQNINLPVGFFGTGPHVKIFRRRDRVQQTVFSSYFVDGRCKCEEENKQPISHPVHRTGGCARHTM
jgi:hypothetical protein